ncbi:hypothetical protein C8R46DRAFT_1045343 [Mycena filopes]|nr:hypothetical protein C8R46DRAFT_1045343 [Mycena filopes]
MSVQKPHTAEELAKFASQIMRVEGDPNLHRASAFSSLTTSETMQWVMEIDGVNEVDPRFRMARDAEERHGIATNALRKLLWDMQRFDYLFPGAECSARPDFDVLRLGPWLGWEQPHKELLDACVKRETPSLERWRVTNSLIVTQFNLLAFNRHDLTEGNFMTPPEDSVKSWIGAKKIMCHASLEITEGGGEIPFLVYFHEHKIMIMEVLEVKRVRWPETGQGKFFKKLLANHEANYGPYQDDGRPERASKFMEYLEARLRARLPPGTSSDDVRLELEKHLVGGQQVSEEYLLMFARLLSHNSDLVRKSCTDSLQLDASIPVAVRETTHISFFVPCLRPRFRIIEQIETGLPPTPRTLCASTQCNKKESIVLCRTCNSVMYCGEDCARTHWPTHQRDCRISRKLRDLQSHIRWEALYVPLRASSYWVADFGFANPREAVWVGSPSRTECPINEYGSKRFICRAVMESARDAQIAHPERNPRKPSTYKNGMALLYDRRRSVLVRFGLDEARRARERGSRVPFHDAKYGEFSDVVRKRGLLGHTLYLWVRRVGDCLEIE